MLNIFEKTGYVIDKQILNAWEHGAPQKRERLITIGIRKDLIGKMKNMQVLVHFIHLF